MPRFGCKQCGSVLPEVTGGEPVRVRCARDSCGWINIIPPNPDLSPWEIRGAAGLTEAFDQAGRLLVSPAGARRLPGTRRPVHIIFPLTMLTLVVVLMLPVVRHEIQIRWAIYRLSRTNNAVEADQLCQGLREIGPTAARAAPAVWALRGKRMNRGLLLKQDFLASVVGAIDPKFLHETAHSFSPADLKEVRSQSLARSAEAEGWLKEMNGDTPLPRLIEGLSFTGDARVRKQAALLLGKRGPNAKAATPALTAVVQERFDDARLEAAEALGQIGPAAAAALPALEQMSRSRISAEKEAATRSILRIATPSGHIAATTQSAGLSDR